MTQVIEGFKVIVAPNGQNGDGGFQISIMLFPELSGGATGNLSDFPDFVDWPQTLAASSYGFALTLQPPAKKGTTVSPITVDLHLDGADATFPLNSDLWTTLFDGSTPYVQRAAPSSASGQPGASTDYAANPPLDAPIVSYPVTAVADFVTGQYENLPLDRKPNYADLQAVYGDVAAGLVGEAGAQAIARQAAARQARTASGKAALVNDFADATTAEALAAQRYFLTPPKSPLVESTSQFSQFSPNPVEFHAALTFIGHHRALQRALGLVFDFTFSHDSDAFSTHSGDGWLISAALVQFTGDGGANVPFAPQSPEGGAAVSAVMVSPPTTATVSPSAFYADTAPASPITVFNGGQVGVQPGGTGGFGTHTISTELAGLNVATFAQKLSTWVSPVGSDGSVGSIVTSPDEAILPPTFDATGISLALVANAQAYLQAFERQGLLYETYDPTGTLYQKYRYPLFANDLVRGLSMDVLDTTVGPAPGTWYSLHDRNVTYSPRPGATFTAFDAYDVAGLQNQPALGIAVDGTPQWYVTETLLVFNGWSNAIPFPGVPVQDADAALDEDGPFSDVIDVQVTPAPVLSGSTNPSVVLPRLRFGRTYEIGVRTVDLANNAVSLSVHEDFNGYSTAPVLFGREDVVPSPDVYPQNGSASYPITGEGLLKLVIRDLDGPNAKSVRALAPPRVTPNFAITHGMLDTENGALPTDSSASTVFSKVAGLAEGQYVAAAVAPSGTTSTPAPVIPSVPVNQTVPYIPDPLARGGALRIDPGYVVSDPANNGLNATTPLLFPFQSGSGDLVTEITSYPVMLELVPGAPGAHRSVSFSGSTVTVQLQPADVTILDLSCTFNQDDLASAPTGYGLGSAVQQASGFDAKSAAMGGCWAITPDVQIQLVYARQFPSLAPTFTALTPSRNVGDTFVTLSGSMRWSPNSTSKIDVIASWTTPVDNGPGTGAPDPSPSPTENVPVLTAPAPMQVPPVPDSTSDSSGSVTQLTVTTPTTAPANPAITGFASAGRELTDVTDAFANGRHEFRDTKYRLVAYGAYATSRFTEYFPEILAQNDPSQFQNPDPEAGEQIFTFQAIVPSSARPAAVSISSVVPIYSWDGPTPKGKRQITSGRNPSALRIYLERPWWSSGDGELLGVITWPGAEAGASATANERRRASERRAETQRREATERRELAEERQVLDREHANAARNAGAELHGEVSARHIERARVTPEAKRTAHTSGPAVTVPSPINQYVSDWGLDPVFASATNLPSAHPQLATFTNATHDGMGVALEELGGDTVNVAGHPVFYDSVSDRWYADIAVDFGQAYNPMVRLAVARYQPNSISGVEIGRVSVVDVHALEQGRSVQITRNAASTELTVTLTGVSYTRAANRDTIAPEFQTSIDVSPGQAFVQLQHSNAKIADPELRWQPAAANTEMDAQIDASGAATWTATVPVPGVGKSYRLALLQYELLPAIDDTGNVQLAPRLLFQDLVPLTFGTGTVS